MRGSGSRFSSRKNKRKTRQQDSVCSDIVDLDEVENKMTIKTNKRRKGVDDEDKEGENYDGFGYAATVREEDIELEASELSGLVAKLPIDIFMDILLRLPIKTLSQCKWVSKAWLRAIKHHRFIQKHHAKVIENNSPCVILVDKYRKCSYLLDHEDLETFETSMESYKPKFPRFFAEMDSCNGLVFTRREQYFICNPITGDHMEVPKPSTPFGFEETATGFGFDDVSKVFKFVRVIEKVEDDVCCGTCAEVYNVSTGKWSSINDVPYGFQGNTKPNFLNGALYWIGNCHLTSTYSKVIIFFKLDTEEFNQFPFPASVRLDPVKPQPYLLVLEECLSIVHVVHNGTINIWARTIGLQPAWVRKYSIGRIVMDGELVKGPYKPILLMKNGDILVLCSYQNLGYYDPETRKFRPIVINKRLHPKSALHPILHVGSLLSPGNVGKLKI